MNVASGWDVHNFLVEALLLEVGVKVVMLTGSWACAHAEDAKAIDGDSLAPPERVAYGFEDGPYDPVGLTLVVTWVW